MPYEFQSPNARFMIYYVKPFCHQKRLGYIHNQYCEIVPNDDDWICIMDPDVMFLVPDTQRHIESIISTHGHQWDVLGCLTNRIGVLEQCYPIGEMSNSSDMEAHKQMATGLHILEKDKIIETKLVAGFLMLFKKSLWNRIKFQEGINFDIKFCEAVKTIGGKIGIMKGIYVFHLYRWGQENPKSYKKHLL